MDKQLIEELRSVAAISLPRKADLLIRAADALERIDAERRKDVIGYIEKHMLERIKEYGFAHAEISTINRSSSRVPIFLSSTIPADFSLYLEPALISAEHAKWEAGTILADDDPSYDTFCGGWKAAFKLIAAA